MLQGCSTAHCSARGLCFFLFFFLEALVLPSRQGMLPMFVAPSGGASLVEVLTPQFSCAGSFLPVPSPNFDLWMTTALVGRAGSTFLRLNSALGRLCSWWRLHCSKVISWMSVSARGPSDADTLMLEGLLGSPTAASLPIGSAPGDRGALSADAPPVALSSSPLWM